MTLMKKVIGEKMLFILLKIYARNNQFMHNQYQAQGNPPGRTPSGIYLLLGRLHVCYSLETSNATENKALLTRLFEELYITPHPQES